MSTLTNSHKVLLGIATEDEKNAHETEERQAAIESAANAIEMALDYLSKDPDSLEDVEKSIRAAVGKIRRNIC
jgi:3-dehydroquinate dehydratase